MPSSPTPAQLKFMRALGPRGIGGIEMGDRVWYRLCPLGHRVHSMRACLRRKWVESAGLWSEQRDSRWFGRMYALTDLGRRILEKADAE